MNFFDEILVFPCDKSWDRNIVSIYAGLLNKTLSDQSINFQKEKSQHKVSYACFVASSIRFSNSDTCVHCWKTVSTFAFLRLLW